MPRRSFSHALRPAPAVSVRRHLKRSLRPSAVPPAPAFAAAGARGPSRLRVQLRSSVAAPALLPARPWATCTVDARDRRPAPITPVDPDPPARGQLMLPGFAPMPAPRRPAAPAGAARETLAAYPDLPAADLCRHAKRLGTSAELLVDSLLTRLGERVFPVDEHEPFDRILWLSGRPLRVQVKARHRRVGDVWPFNITKGYQRGPVGTRPYDIDDFDLLALVILPEGVVKFVPRGGSHHRIHQSEIAALRAHPRACLDAALRALGRDEAVPPRTEPDAA